MSEKSEKKNLEKQVPNNVIPLGPTRCMAEECKAKPARAGFCNEHFEWFKAGLVTKTGARAADFEKKFYQYQQSRYKKVA